VGLRGWLPLLTGTVLAGLLVGTLTPAEPPCAYVLSQVGADTVATPALVVFVPPEQAAVQPVRVHLDEAGRNILGYSLRPARVGSGPDAGNVFFRGIPEAGTSLAPLPALGGRVRACSHLGVSTPAVPVHVPTSVLDLPGALEEVPTVTLALQGTSMTTPGHVITLAGHTLVLPQPGAVPETSERDRAEQSLRVALHGSDETARYLPPPHVTAEK
jgi:hypothetical protein